jgi:hypothetical protein
MAETLTHVVGNAPPNHEDKLYKIYSCEGKRDFPVIKKECSGTQTSVQLNGKRGISPDVENKENQTSGEVSCIQIDQFVFVFASGCKAFEKSFFSFFVYAERCCNSSKISETWS